MFPVFIANNIIDFSMLLYIQTFHVNGQSETSCRRLSGNIHCSKRLEVSIGMQRIHAMSSLGSRDHFMCKWMDS